MKKLRYIGLFPIVISLAALSFGQGSTEVNKIDGFTSASIKLMVDSVLVYRDHADVYWWEKYPDSVEILKYQIEWGTKDSIHYTDTLKLQPYKKLTRYVAKIQPLNDSTTYFAQFHRDYHGTVKYTKFSFNTPPLQNSVRHTLRPWVMPSSKNITGLDMYTMSGRRVFHADIARNVDAGSIRPQVSAPGLYIVNYTGAGNKLVNSEMSLFGR
jgi:hypothetical protein